MAACDMGKWDGMVTHGGTRAWELACSSRCLSWARGSSSVRVVEACITPGSCCLFHSVFHSSRLAPVNPCDAFSWSCWSRTLMAAGAIKNIHVYSYHWFHCVSSRHWPSPLTLQDAVRIAQGLLLTSSPMAKSQKKPGPRGGRHLRSSHGQGDPVNNVDSDFL